MEIIIMSSILEPILKGACFNQKIYNFPTAEFKFKRVIKTNKHEMGIIRIETFSTKKSEQKRECLLCSSKLKAILPLSLI